MIIRSCPIRGPPGDDREDRGRLGDTLPSPPRVARYVHAVRGQSGRAALARRTSTGFARWCCSPFPAAVVVLVVVVISRIPAGYACPRNAVLNRRFPIGLRFRGVGGLVDRRRGERERDSRGTRAAVSPVRVPFVRFPSVCCRDGIARGRGKAEREAGRKEGRKKSGDEGGERRRVESESE